LLGPAIKSILREINERGPSVNNDETGFLKPKKVWSNPFEPNLESRLSELLQAPGNFIGRLGGSDFEAVAQHHYRAQHLSKAIESVFGKLFNSPNRVPYSHPLTILHLQKVRQLNGFFDIQGKLKNYYKYLDTLSASYESVQTIIYGTQLVYDAVDSGRDHHPFHSFLSDITADKELISNAFLETIRPFIQSMHHWAVNRKILIVSPFSQSVIHQYQQRSGLHRGIALPQFELITYTSPVTYSSLGNYWQRPIQAKSSNWSQELERMTEEILALDFEVALLSCGSYAMPLGVAIAETNRSALYLGGVLNPLFGIYGLRYDTPFYHGIVNQDQQITVMEAPNLDRIKSGRSLPSEGLRAYTGTHNKI
jgi:hypothetical protein